MSIKISKRTIKWAIAAVAVCVVAFIGFRFWKKQQTALPDGIASGNGRIEAKLVDMAAKEPLRVKEVLVDEGALVKPGQVLVRLDTVTLEAELEEAKAKLDAAEERLEFSRASIAKQKSEIKLAGIEVKRSRNLVAEGAGSQRELDVRSTKLETTNATLAEARAMLETATQQVEAARAAAHAIQTRIDDATLRATVAGRVLYRLLEPGELAAAGSKVLTLVNLEDLYMEIFLPSDQAARVKLGSEGRVTVDVDQKRSIAGQVSFVSPEAQFTPKQVETRDEREKLMFRVKIQLPQTIARAYRDRIKTGIRGMGYVKLDPSATWPKWLQNVVRARAQPV